MADASRAARRQVLLRLDPAVHDALTRWAADELRSVNAQVELVIRRALGEAGRLPRDAGPLPRRGRPPRSSSDVPPPERSVRSQSPGSVD